MRPPLFALPFVLSATLLAQTEPGTLPDPARTPGATLDVTRDDICTPGYTQKVRNVPSAVKRRAYASYGRRKEKGVCCEVDHLIPLELGGSNDLRNLWPEPYDIAWNAHVKDRLENKLHTLVCRGTLDLATAQRAIAADWVSAYQRYVGASTSATRRP